jgi:hypothetical protein
MTILKVPKVKIFIGRSKSLIIGFKTNSKILKTRATLIIVPGIL